MSLGVIPMFLFGFLVNFGENHKMSKKEKLGKNQAFAATKDPHSGEPEGQNGHPTDWL